MISLLHATRGRPHKAIETCKLFLERAFNKGDIEYIFAVDRDDEISVDIIGDFVMKNMVNNVLGMNVKINCGIVPNPNGCVRAWNLAARHSLGDILVQLSDDWIPPMHWDKQIAQRLDITKARCLQVSDGSRKDDLMCMAIITRKRFEQQTENGQPYMFHPSYFGVYSDTEYSLRAFKDKVVVKALDIVFEHEHPVFGKAEWDDTYLRQNDKQRYEEGKAIFMSRNKFLIS